MRNGVSYGSADGKTLLTDVTLTPRETIKGRAVAEERSGVDGINPALWTHEFGHALGIHHSELGAALFVDVQLTDHGLQRPEHLLRRERRYRHEVLPRPRLQSERLQRLAQRQP